ncbi:MAG: hypothetical protein K1X83_10085 [Oligoflexia bacterium]|nr:hypothetical protein [Oligoflexia bacterium]
MTESDDLQTTPSSPPTAALGPACPVCHRPTTKAAKRSSRRLIGVLLGQHRYLCPSCLIGFDVGWLGRSHNFLKRDVLQIQSNSAPVEAHEQAREHNLQPATSQDLLWKSNLSSAPSAPGKNSILDLNLAPLGIRVKVEVDGAKFTDALLIGVSVCQAALREASHLIAVLCKEATRPPVYEEQSRSAQSFKHDPAQSPDAEDRPQLH